MTISDPPTRLGRPSAITPWWAIVLLAAALAVTDLVFLHAPDAGQLVWGFHHPQRTLTRALCIWLAEIVAAAAIVRIDFARLDTRAGQMWLCAAALVAAGVIGALVLRSFPNSGDEYAYLFQGWTYRAGRLWNAPPPLGQAMASKYTWVSADKWAGAYAPGWPLAMILPQIFGLPGWTINLPLLAIATATLHELVSRRAGRGLAIAAAALFALSPFTLFNAASFFPHMAAATLTLLACRAIDALEGGGSRRSALALGATIGMLVFTRSIDAPLVALVLIAPLLVQRHFWTRSAWWIGLGGAPFVAALLAYQWALTGSPLVSTYHLGGRTLDRLYFDMPSLRTGAWFTLNRLRELGCWISPAAMLAWPIALGIKARARRIERIDMLLPLLLLLFLFYPFEGGNRYGPRYLFDFWPGLAFTLATALSLLGERLRRFGDALIALGILFGVVLTPFLAEQFHMIVSERGDIYDHMAGLPGRAIVCIRNGSGKHFQLGPEDLPRNGIVPDGRVLLVRCDPGIPAAARRVYPDRALWYYDRAGPDVQGRFTRG